MLVGLRCGYGGGGVWRTLLLVQVVLRGHMVAGRGLGVN